jgi:hypothetical protein
MRDPTRVAALLLALPGLAVPFLPFCDNRSPLQVLNEGSLALLGGPFFLAIPIVIWQARKLIGRRVSSIEIVAAYVLSVGAMLSGVVSAGLSMVDLKPSNFDGLKDVLIGMAILGSPFIFGLANVLLLARNIARRVSREFRAEIFLLGGYVPNAVFCLLMFGTGFFHLDIGGKVAVVACIAYMITIVLTLCSSKRRSSDPVYAD